MEDIMAEQRMSPEERQRLAANITTEALRVLERALPGVGAARRPFECGSFSCPGEFGCQTSFQVHLVDLPASPV